jgi:DNA repair exonuclease SbcCD ATPase subunit
MPKEKDPLDEILDDIKDVDDDEDLNLEDDEAMEELKTQLQEMEKKNTGLLKEVKAQRRKRQDTEKRLDKLTDTVDNILQQRQAPDGVKATTGGSKKTALEYDDDGNPVFDTELIGQSETIQELNEKVANLEALIQALGQQQQTESDSSKIIQAIVGEDERYGSAYNKYQNARKWVEDKVIDYQNENNVGGLMPSGQALDHVFDEDLEKEFKDKFGELNLERVVTAEDSQRHFRNTLKSIADAMTPEEGGNDSKEGSRFKKVLQKASGLSGTANQKGAQLSLEEKLANLGSEDILGLTDEQAAQVEKALEKL